MSPADIKRDNQDDTTVPRVSATKTAPQTPPVFNPTAKSSNTAPTIETVPTRTDSDPSFEPGHGESHERQVIAVSVSKGPSAFFNLARKFLVTDEECDLSALEGAIVSAVDAAHLLERSQIATISRVQTSYVTVDPKKKKELYVAQEGSSQFHHQHMQQSPPIMATSLGTSPALDALAAAAQIGRENMEQSMAALHSSRQRGNAGTLRRARMIITVHRTQAYKKWLEENPVQDIITGDDE